MFITHFMICGWVLLSPTRPSNNADLFLLKSVKNSVHGLNQPAKGWGLVLATSLLLTISLNTYECFDKEPG
jgi:hypothetical protein